MCRPRFTFLFPAFSEQTVEQVSVTRDCYTKVFDNTVLQAMQKLEAALERADRNLYQLTFEFAQTLVLVTSSLAIVWLERENSPVIMASVFVILGLQNPKSASVLLATWPPFGHQHFWFYVLIY